MFDRKPGESYQSFFVDKGWIYYADYVDDYLLHRMKTDGTEDTVLSDFSCYGVNLVGDWLYCFPYGFNKLTRIKVDGSEKETVFK